MMDLEVFITYSIVIVVAGLTALLVGAAIAKLLGFKLNEPEYYEAKKDKKNGKR
jgi:hypothetical protein